MVRCVATGKTGELRSMFVCGVQFMVKRVATRGLEVGYHSSMFTKIARRNKKI
jgi:hypothetical protein